MATVYGLIERHIWHNHGHFTLKPENLANTITEIIFEQLIRPQLCAARIAIELLRLNRFASRFQQIETSWI